jgi:tetratricopeptide (TPR) repeat protein
VHHVFSEPSTARRPFKNLGMTLSLRTGSRERYTSSRLTQQEIDNSTHRLSQVPQRLGKDAGTSEASGSYAAGFFRDNPDVPLDKRAPTEKIEDIDSRLDGELEDSDRFNLLVQRKSLCFLAFGENSPESLESLRFLGEFYNQQNRPESALRHLAKAQQISSTVTLSETEGLALALELADAHLASKATSRQESKRQVSAAEAALNPYAEIEPENDRLCYKRDLLLGRIRARLNKYDEALPLFNRAIEALDRANAGEKTQVTAALYGEIGECAEAANDQKTAGRMYRTAHQIFLELEMPEAAGLIEPKLRRDAEPDSEDEHGSRKSGH